MKIDPVRKWEEARRERVRQRNWGVKASQQGEMPIRAEKGEEDGRARVERAEDKEGKEGKGTVSTGRALPGIKKRVCSRAHGSRNKINSQISGGGAHQERISIETPNSILPGAHLSPLHWSAAKDAGQVLCERGSSFPPDGLATVWFFQASKGRPRIFAKPIPC